MITSHVIQASNAAIEELLELYPNESDVDDAMADMGIGPRALAGLVENYGSRFESDTKAAMLFAFLNGVISTQIATALDSGEMVLLDLDQDLEPLYENAFAGDLQDMLLVNYGVVTDDEIDITELIDVTLQTVLGVSMADLTGEDEDEPSSEAVTDPIDPAPTAAE